ncbi:hypothetical protein E4U42_002358 [Claviceps africana]|uniref:Ras modification protein ERF4 n=1 Tax=Claviceps africana TaxID=83212 RepID=A0A8K0JEB8_9HYPO|nr:hypothetical protein E4U42_002358 [Claviceps africana]
MGPASWLSWLPWLPWLPWPFRRQQCPPPRPSHESQCPVHAPDSHARPAPLHNNTRTHLDGRRRVFAAPSPPPPPSPSSPSTTARPSPDPYQLGTPAIASPAHIAATVHSGSRPSIPPEHCRLDGCANATPFTTPTASTTSNAFESSPAPIKAQGYLVKTYSQQPHYPVTSLYSAAEPSSSAFASGIRDQQAAALGPRDTNLVTSPFRKRNLKGNPPVGVHQSGRPSASRLWNPTNSTPRIPKQQRRRQRQRRPSTPPPPTLLLQHPALRTLAETNDPFATTAGSYPLLTLSEQRQSRHAASPPTSLLVDRAGTSDHRISLPRSFSLYSDGKRYHPRTSTGLDVTKTTPGSSSCVEAENVAGPSAKSKGKQKATMATAEETRRSCSRDLEHGPDVMDNRISAISGVDGIGSSLASSNSSIMGEDVQPDAGEEWGPQHPCYPHLNPHVPLDSTEYATTRIIRVKRDWLLAGDLAPTFSDLYPEILDPAGVSEQEFRRVVEKLNAELIPIFDPFGFRNMLDSVLGLVTGWLWDDFGLTAAKSRLNHLEKWMERWNLEMEKTMSSEEGVMPPKLIPLRQTAYMSLDIQIPDPEIAPAPSSIGASDSRTALPLEPMPVMMAER